MRPRSIVPGVIVAVLLAASPRARGEPGAIVVDGKGSATDKQVAARALSAAFQAGGWTTNSPPFTPKESAAITKCVRAPRPVACVAPIARGKQLQQIAVVSVEPKQAPDGRSMVALYARVVVLGIDSVVPGERYCTQCTDDLLTKQATDLAQEVLGRVALRRARSMLSIKSTPQGAMAYVDGESAGATDVTMGVVPGVHQVRIEKEGFETVERTVEAVDGTTTEVSETLRVVATAEPTRRPPVAIGQPVSTPTSPPSERPPVDERPSEVPPPPPPRSLRRPIALLVVGALAIAGGAVALAYDEDPVGPGEKAHEFGYNTIIPGGIAIGVGVLAAGLGGYLWWTYRRPAAVATIAPTTGGAVVGLTGRF